MYFFRWKQFGILHLEDPEKKGQVGCSLEDCEFKGSVFLYRTVTTKNFQVQFWTEILLGCVFIWNSDKDFLKKKSVSCSGEKHSESKSEFTTFNIELFEVFHWNPVLCYHMQWTSVKPVPEPILPIATDLHSVMLYFFNP